MLFKALSVFALRDIDMTKIESRPMRTNPILLSKASLDGGAPQQRFNYLFYVDFVGSLADQQSQNALRHLQVGWGACGGIWSRRLGGGIGSSEAWRAVEQPVIALLPQTTRGVQAMS